MASTSKTASIPPQAALCLALSLAYPAARAQDKAEPARVTIEATRTLAGITGLADEPLESIPMQVDVTTAEQMKVLADKGMTVGRAPEAGIARMKESGLKMMADWRKTARAEAGGPDALGDWQTLEQIPVKPVYTAEDLKQAEHLDYTAGIAPFLRGPYATMYVLKPWTIRRCAG